ncbi:MAG: periplasmic heavy metal sensor [Hyphomicrobiaceae bacterium]|nr:MAG: periplasmic heavy metal sensor [Hyphomicrobiaceae bacterium]
MTDTSVPPVPPAPAPSGLPRWVKITLILSLAVNLLLVGSIIGHRLATRHGPFASVFRSVDDATRFARKLPAERRQALRAIFEKHREEFRPLVTAVQEARKGVEATLSAEPFDKDKFIAALAALQEAESKARASRRPMAAEMAAILTPEERKRFMSIHGGLQRELRPPGDRRRFFERQQPPRQQE